MKNSSVVAMVMNQYGWDKRDVEVTFIEYSEDAYKFEVVHDHPYDNELPVKLSIEIKVEYK